MTRLFKFYGEDVPCWKNIGVPSPAILRLPPEDAPAVIVVLLKVKRAGPKERKVLWLQVIYLDRVVWLMLNNLEAVSVVKDPEACLPGEPGERFIFGNEGRGILDPSFNPFAEFGFSP